MNTRLFDLRFVIGMFFLIIGTIVLLSSFIASDKPNGSQVNLYSGLSFVGFALIMLWSFRQGTRKQG